MIRGPRVTISSNASALILEIDEVEATQRALGTLILQLRPSPAGPKAVSYHHGLLLERLQDLRIIIERIGVARARSVELADRAERYRPKRELAGKPYSKRLQGILRESSDLTRRMRLDAESLYVFSNLLLDQWSFTIAYALGLPNPTSYRYFDLVNHMQGGTPPEALVAMRDRHLADALWLSFQVRFYRNAFIEHVERPWQRGTTMGVYGKDLNFFITSPPDWLDPAYQAQLLDGVRRLAPAWVDRLPEDSWQRQPRAVLEATYREIDHIPRQVDRERVWDAWKELGGSTVSFDVLARRLFAFLRDSTATVREYVTDHPEAIDLGHAPRRS